MRELANKAQGERVAVHADTVELKVTVQTPGRPGGPRNVVGPNRLPLYIPVDTTADELRRIVNDQPGRYRFLQVDRNRRLIEGTDPLYLDILDTDDTSSDNHAGDRDRDHERGVLRELVRANSDMVKVVAQNFASMLGSAAHLIRAADGAGLPAREPAPATATAPAAPAPVDTAAEGDDRAEPGGLGYVLGQMIGQAQPLLQHCMLTKVMGLSPEQATAVLGALSGAVKPAPVSDATATPPPTATTTTTNTATAAPPPTARAAPVDPIKHMNAIEALLSARERAVVFELIKGMTADQIPAWQTRLCGMSAAEAAATIRAEIAALEKPRAVTGGAS